MPTQRGANAECPICHGVGFFRRDVPIDDPDFGRAIPCPHKLTELAHAQLNDLRHASGLAMLSRMTFETFMPDGLGLTPDKQRQLREAYQAAEKFATHPEGWLILKGGYGCGKTHLAAAIANHQIELGQAVLFIVVPDLLDYLRSTFAPTSAASYDERFESIRTAPLLILDDYGAQSATQWANEKLFQIFNYRYNAQLPTVVTTNRELEEMDARVRSRLTDLTLSHIITITASDFRQGHDRGSSDLSSLSLHADMTFDTFESNRADLSHEQRENLRKAWEIAKEYAENPEGWLILTGDYGVGKTHLAAAIANARVERGESALFVVVPDLLDHLRAAFSPNSPVSFDRRFEEVRTTPFLVLDDLGTQSSTPWAQEKLFQILNYRYAAKLPTVFTIGKDVEIDERMKTRLFDVGRNLLFDIYVPGYRRTAPRAAARSNDHRRGRKK
ncbi:MAG TPA: ATP-binding protein [Anaerolineae bacterium]